MVAPAAEGEFGQDITMESWRVALKKVGFTDMVEVAAGADMTAAYEANGMGGSIQGRQEDDDLLLSGIRKYDQETLSDSDR